MVMQLLRRKYQLEILLCTPKAESLGKVSPGKTGIVQPKAPLKAIGFMHKPGEVKIKIFYLWNPPSLSS